MTLAVIVEGLEPVRTGHASRYPEHRVSPNPAGQLVEMTGKLCAVYITEKEIIPQREVIDQG